jgi:aminopeptidase N
MGLGQGFSWRAIRRWVLSLAGVAAVAQGASARVSLPEAGPGAGVSRALAAGRAAVVSDVHYSLDFGLAKHADAMPGHEVLRFSLSAASMGKALALDYRDGAIASARLNGKPVPTTLSEGHLMLPAQQLVMGGNTVEISFTSRVASAGAATTRYEDKNDGSEYVYSLFVPMDASMAFPCFDQPDLKARFTLNVTAPEDWTVIGNTRPQRMKSADKDPSTSFPETRPIPTYLFAFAAGPWARLAGKPGEPDVYVRRSQLKRAEPEVPQLQSITAQGMRWLADYFQQPFPFPKYDIVLIPGFPFGGMEHAGETFLNEDGVLFRTAPTASDRFHRDILTLHELTHQWFGDLVTMRWFDDLWLKEGFAQYMAYRAEDALHPESQAWKHFYEDIKPQAYGIDETLGTTPIFQDIPNLKDAKSAYGAIVYQKAPAILKQLEFRLGAEAFRDGLRLYLRDHAYANAQWGDLIGAFHTASGQDVRSWADAWVLRRGMPEVNVNWRCGPDNRIAKLTLSQHDVLPDGYVWPISNEVQLGLGDSVRVDWNSAEAEVPAAIGKPCPAFVFANGGDEAYGRFLLDSKSERSVRQLIVEQRELSPVGLHAHGEPGIVSGRASSEPAFSPLLRSMLWGALWDNVHEARSSPRVYVDLVIANLPYEQDETLARIQGDHAATALHRYMAGQGRASLAAQVEQIATAGMLHASTAGLRIISFRTLTSVAETASARGTLKDLLAGKEVVPGVELRQLDRWNLVGRLITLADADAPAIFAAEFQRDQTGDGQKYAWAVQAGAPDAAAKERYFAQYTMQPTDKNAKPEDWLTESLRPFNSWNQSALTEPYLRRALQQLPEIKRDRKIFFLGAWLGAFLDGQISPEAEAVVKQWLAQPGIEPDLRLKVLENADELERTVRIRQRFPQ